MVEIPLKKNLRFCKHFVALLENLNFKIQTSNKMKLQDLRIYFPHTEESNVGERKTIRDQPKSVGYSATVSNSKHILN